MPPRRPRHKKLVRVNTSCVAGAYAGPGETIIEFSGSRLGGLLSLREDDHGKIFVDLYRADQGVTVHGPRADEPLRAALRGWLAIFDREGAFISPLVETALRNTRAALGG